MGSSGRVRSVARAAGLAALGAGAAAFFSPALAQSSPPPIATRLPDPGQALRGAVERAAPTPGPLAADGTELQFTSQTPPANARDIHFQLTGVQLSGATIYDEAALADAWQAQLGGEIDLIELFAIAARIQQRYRDDGYLFTRVIVPAQRIEGGRARLEVVEAVITTVAIETPAAPLGPVQALAEQIIAPLRGRRNPTLAELEQVLLQLNDIPGVTRAAAVPKVGGEERGAIDLHINMERDPISLALFADNRQSPILGPGMVGAVATLNSWTRWGDTTSLSWFNSNDWEDLLGDSWEERWTAQFEHVHFFGSSGLSGAFRVLHSESEPGDIVKTFDITSDQTEVEASLRYPLRRTRALSVDMIGGLEAVQVNSLTPAVVPIPGIPAGPGLVTDDRLNVLFIGWEVAQRDADGTSDGRIEIRTGLPILDASRAGDPNLSRDDGDGVFWLIRGEASRTQVLGDGFSLWGKAWGQLADRPLLASEEMAIGGPELGRAYDPSEYAGDIGLGVAAEIRYGDEVVLDDLRAPIEVYAFADWSEVRNLDGGSPIHASLVSAGFGVRATLPGRFSVNLEAAKPVNVPLAYDQSKDWRLLFSAVKEF